MKVVRSTFLPSRNMAAYAAARATGKPNPLTKSLRLERTLGLPLFDRHAKGMRPNDYGERFRPTPNGS